MRRTVGVIVILMGLGLAVASAYAAVVAARAGRFQGVVLFPLAFGLLLALAGARVARGRRSMRASPGRVWDGSPVAIPPDEIEQKDGEWVACLRCGATAVRPMTLREGLVPGGGETLSTVCGRCGFRGAPLVFDNATSYRAFVKGLHAERAPPEETTP